jgi:hypothetical protein
MSEIKSELARLFSEQAAFFQKGRRAKHTEPELADYEKRRARIRDLFAEMDDLRKTA